MDYHNAKVFLSREHRKVAILCLDDGSKVEAVLSDNKIFWKKMKSSDFHRDYTGVSKSPATAAAIMLAGTRSIDARATVALTAISKLEYQEMAKTAAAAAAKVAAPPPKAAAAPAPKVPKVAKVVDPNAPPKAKKVYAAVPYTAENKITFVTNPNPKRGASAARFANYKVGQTIAAACEAGLTKGDIAWDLARGLIKI